MQYKKAIANSLQVVLGIVGSILLGLAITYYGWSFAINIAGVFENQGYTIDLVGDPRTIDPGAVIVAGIYLLLIILISYIMIKKTKYKVFGATFCICSIFMSFIVFSLVSSLIWF